jgi:hypothetical protein
VSLSRESDSERGPDGPRLERARHVEAEGRLDAGDLRGSPALLLRGDKGREIACQHLKLHGGFWYVVKPNGMANMAKGSGIMM